jgi:hypothetical protein
MKTIFTNILLLSAAILMAQDSLINKNSIIPVQIEALVGNNRFVLSAAVIKPFTVQSKFTILSVSQTANNYNNNLADFDLVNLTQVSYNVFRGFGPILGINTNNVSGFYPDAGLQYVLSRPTISFIISPDIGLTVGHYIEGIAILEYKPHIKKKFSLYTRVTGFYSYDIDNRTHGRSFFVARLGISYDRFTFGAGVNLDWYGPMKILKQNYGPHVMYLFL